jgi:subtilisin family serine protease
MNSVKSVKLTDLMGRSRGCADVVVGLIDGPVAVGHPDLAGARVREIPGGVGARCALADSAACVHGTFVAGILCAQRESAAPSICPDCTLLVRPIFAEVTAGRGVRPASTAEELAAAVVECVAAGARVLNLSVALERPSLSGTRELEAALDRAARSGVIVVAASGNQGTLRTSTITRHPWVIPVIGYDLRGRPMDQSNLGASIGRRGLGAPGEGISSVSVGRTPLTVGGTSAATPFVTGAVALLWSVFPAAPAAEVKTAVLGTPLRRRRLVVPPLLDAQAAYQAMAAARTWR